MWDKIYSKISRYRINNAAAPKSWHPIREDVILAVRKALFDPAVARLRWRKIPWVALKGHFMILTIRDETAAGAVTNELTLDVLTEKISVRELIRSRVYQEVQDFNLRQRQGVADFLGLVTPTDAERTLNGVRLKKPREIDWKKQFDKACEAFDHNGFFILVGDRQAGSLEEEVTLAHNTAVSFVKLVPLVGG